MTTAAIYRPRRIRSAFRFLFMTRTARVDRFAPLVEAAFTRKENSK